MPTLPEVRVEQGLRQEDLAKLAGVATNTVIRMEAGEPVRRSNAEKVASVLKVNLETLTGIKIYSALQTAARRRTKKNI